MLLLCCLQRQYLFIKIILIKEDIKQKLIEKYLDIK